MRWFILAAVVAGLALAAVGVIGYEVVLAPLLGLFIFTVGAASLRSLRTGADHIPDRPPEPVDPREERVSYVCTGCGAELLLVVRGTPVPPRHCGEKMHERRQVLVDRNADP